MQIELFEAADRVVWQRLPEEAREDVVELLARSVVRCLGQLAGECEADDDR